MARKKTKKETQEETQEETQTIETVDVSIAQQNSTVDDANDGFEDWDDDDLILPRFQILQGTSSKLKPGWAPGGLLDTLSENYVQSAQCAFLLYRKGMVLWPSSDTDDRTGMPLCRSSNRITPDPDIENPVCQTCHKKVGPNKYMSVCPSSKWGSNNEPPECKKTYTLLGLELSNDIPYPFFVTLHGKSIKSVRRFLSYVRSIRSPLYGIKCELSTTQETNARGTFYVVNFSSLTPTQPDERASFKALYEQMKELDLSRSIQRNDEIDEEQQSEQYVGDPTDFDPNTF